MATKSDWLDALRGHGYDQGFGGIRTSHFEFCAIGVALDLIDPQGWRVEEGAYTWQGLECLDPPYEILAEHFGLDCDAADEIVDMNDEWRRPFAKIADYIESV